MWRHRSHGIGFFVELSTKCKTNCFVRSRSFPNVGSVEFATVFQHLSGFGVIAARCARIMATRAACNGLVNCLKKR